MSRLATIFLLSLYVVSCSPKLASTASTDEYTEDVSAFRPKVEVVEDKTADVESKPEQKSKFVPPTNDISEEMDVLMDSIVYHNRDKLYLTYTIQVYIGRSREEANTVRENVYRVLPEEKPELVYRQPSWKVLVGKYVDRVEAYRALTILKDKFPGAMLVPQHETIQ